MYDSHCCTSSGATLDLSTNAKGRVGIITVYKKPSVKTARQMVAMISLVDDRHLIPMDIINILTRVIHKTNVKETQHEPTFLKREV